MNVIRSNAPFVYGTNGPDLIVGGPADQVIFGYGGDDRIFGGNGTDTIQGGSGSDVIHGGQASDRIDGGAGDDQLFGNRGNDTVHGARGTDQVVGGVGDDHLYGGAGSRDALTGGMGIDVLDGGTGDHDMLRGDAGPDYLDGGGGVGDTVGYQTATPPGYDKSDPRSGVLVDLDDPVRWRNPQEGVYYPGRVWGGSRADGGSGEDGIRRIDNVIGSGYDDVIRGNGSHNEVDGGPGNDRIDGKVDAIANVEQGGDPFGAQTPFQGPMPVRAELVRSPLGGTSLYVTGGDGAENIQVVANGSSIVVKSSTGVMAIGGAQQGIAGVFELGSKTLGSVVVDARGGNDDVRVLGLPDATSAVIDGGAGNDVLVGGAGDDTIEDGPGDDLLYGMGGDDGLLNAQGRDELYGGSGNDLLVSSSIGEGNVIHGGAGTDNASWAQVGERFAVHAQIGGSAYALGNGPKGVDRIDASIDDLEGTELGDTLIGNGRDNGFLGRSGADTLVGNGGDDSLNVIASEGDTAR